MLSTEEQEELSRSNKKVKNVGHAGFQEGLDMHSSSRSSDYWNQTGTFKDRLVGEVPGAYTQAFSFEHSMEDDIESDEEVETLREGLVAVEFSKDLKNEMRSPWTRALIVKVYGRSMGFNFIHNKLLSMWKPARRLDCLGLGQGFFLTRLSLKEDYENILRKGPWFIGEHFLSIRLWEPNFRPATANVSSVAVRIRLNELPIEVGHRKDWCPYIIRQESSIERTEVRTEGSVPSSPCEMHAPDKVQKVQGSNESVSGIANEEATDGTYGPWVVVTRRRNGTRNLNGGASMVQRIMKAPNAWVPKGGEGSPNSMGVEKGSGRTGLGNEKHHLKPNSCASVKGKKSLARARTLQYNSFGSTKVAKGKVLSLTHHAKDRSAQSDDGGQQP
nr:hypothetical protein CFP56_02045 [Quercus suber]